MTAADVVILILAAAAVAGGIAWAIWRRRHGKGCCAGCSGCGDGHSCAGCEKKTRDKNSPSYSSVYVIVIHNAPLGFMAIL